MEIRIPKQDELQAWFQACEASFADELHEEDVERDRKMIPAERMFGAYDDGAIVGTSCDLPMLLRIPGGELPAAGVTMVGVMPSHRRRGILTQLMRRQLDDALGRGEPLSILWASEEPIYGRFGYGVATFRAAISADRDRIAFRGEPESAGRVRLIDADEAFRVLPPIWDRVQKERPGLFARSPEWWQEYRLPDPEHRRRGSGPRFIAVLELDGSPEAYALYRVKESWDEGFAASRLQVIEPVATTPLAERELWRFLFGIDLVARVESNFLPVDHPLILAVTESRRLRVRVSDGLWLRILDVERALESRSYAAEGTLTVELSDVFMPGNAGTWTLEAGPGGANVSRGGDAELRLDVRDLASAYLGGFSFSQLAAAGLVDELTSGAIDQADSLFRTPRAPWCPQVF
ncbi:MAG TPA: GNAT family N-acetyltransferase [Gaiellaceae bacterium]|nr:GNAT family N-acetyltransferase [Gaiellaceae bacterium]